MHKEMTISYKGVKRWIDVCMDKDDRTVSIGCFDGDGDKVFLGSTDRYGEGWFEGYDNRQTAGTFQYSLNGTPDAIRAKLRRELIAFVDEKERYDGDDTSIFWV